MYKTIPLALAASALFTSATQATLVSINFTIDTAAGKIETGESTGVIATTGWFNTSATIGDVTNALDVNGVATGINIADSRQLVQNSATARDAPNGESNGTDGFLALYEGGIRTSAANQTLTFTNMSNFLNAAGASEYKMIFYFRSRTANDAATITTNIDGGTDTTTQIMQSGAAITYDYGFVEAAGEATTDPDANYIVYDHLTADTTTLNYHRGGADLYLTGVQIEAVAVPEPSSAALLGLGGLALIFRRRK